MSQKLILPINKTKLTASIDTPAYLAKYNFGHYGSDMVSTEGDTTIWASGEGTVVAVGKDSVCGNVVAVLYPGAVNRRTQKSVDLIIRYFHLAKIEVKAGQKVTKDTRLGLYGKTGMMVMPLHLHIEGDTDTGYPLYTPTVTSSNFLKGRSQGAYAYTNPRNTVVNAMDYLHCKTSPPDNQTYTTANDAYIRAEDKAMNSIK